MGLSGFRGRRRGNGWYGVRGQRRCNTWWGQGPAPWGQGPVSVVTPGVGSGANGVATPGGGSGDGRASGAAVGKPGCPPPQANPAAHTSRNANHFMCLLPGWSRCVEACVQYLGALTRVSVGRLVKVCRSPCRSLGAFIRGPVARPGQGVSKPVSIARRI